MCPLDRRKDRWPTRKHILSFWGSWLAKHKSISPHTPCCFACGLVPRMSAEWDNDCAYLDRLEYLRGRGMIGELSAYWIRQDSVKSLSDISASTRTALDRAHIVPFGPPYRGSLSVSNFLLLCHNCHRESEGLIQRETRLLWVLLMSPNIRTYHDLIRRGGLPAAVASCRSKIKVPHSLASENLQMIENILSDIMGTAPKRGDLLRDLDYAIREAPAAGY